MIREGRVYCILRALMPLMVWLFIGGMVFIPYVVVMAADELVWPPPPNEPRIKYVGKLSNSRDVEEKKSVGFFEAIMGEEENVLALAKPYGVAVDREGRVYVTDTSLGKVQVFDRPAKKYRVLGEEGEGVLVKSTGVCVDAEGNVYVSDTSAHAILVYNKTGAFIRRIGSTDVLNRPVGLAIDDRTGRIYVADSQEHKIVVFDKEGKLLFSFGKHGNKPDQFNVPTNLTVKNDKVYVMDTLNFRVNIFDLEGKPIKRWGENGRMTGQFSKPKGIAVDSDGHVYVVDAAFNNVQIFTEDGQLLLFFGSMGASYGKFWLPAGIYIDHEDNIYVADQYNQRVNIFKYLKSKDPEADLLSPALRKRLEDASSTASSPGVVAP